MFLIRRKKRANRPAPGPSAVIELKISHGLISVPGVSHREMLRPPPRSK